MRLISGLATLAITFGPAAALAATHAVGPSGEFATPCEAFAAAQDNDVIEIAAGTYTDMCSIGRNGLTIRGVGGRPVIDAQSSGAQGKGIWIVAGNDTTIENVELVNAKVADQNGAGIRMEGTNLTVRDSVFRNNEDGILESNVAESTIIVERCEFDSNGDGRGQAHNIYIGRAKRFELRDSWSHSAKIGHLVKTRAAENVIEYNRLTGESGNESYELELTMGGRSWVIGNVIEQGPATDNPGMLAYAQEGLRDGENFLYVAHNTFVNHRPNGGTFVLVSGSFSGTATLVNNVFAGPGTVTNYEPAAQAGSCTTPPTFVDEANYDFHLAVGSACVDTGVDPGTGGGLSLTPTSQYVHPTSHEGRVTVGVIDPGAFELGGGVAPGTSSSGGGGGASSGGTPSVDGGAPSASSGGTAAGASSGGGSGGAGAGADDDEDGTDESGCNTTGGSGNLGAAALILGVALVLRRTRRR